MMPARTLGTASWGWMVGAVLVSACAPASTAPPARNWPAAPSGAQGAPGGTWLSPPAGAAPTVSPIPTVVTPTGTPVASVTVRNPLPFPRGPATIALKLADVQKVSSAFVPADAQIADASGKWVDSQLVDMDGDETPDELVFQATFSPGESQSFHVLSGGKRPHPVTADYKVHGRFARERHDDFAWENDRMAHRMYGPDLETYKKDPLISSGVDAWTKRTRRLVIDDWYLTDNYHDDHGDGADFYSVGKSRGLGGVGFFADAKLDKLYTSRNFVSSRVLANGPLRLVFELTYAPSPIGTKGVKVRETKRVIVDAGMNMDRFESTFLFDGTREPPPFAIGIAKHAGSTMAGDTQGGTMQTWEPLKEPNGHLGCAIVLADPSGSHGPTETETDYLLTVKIPAGKPVVYYAGFGWDRSGDFEGEAAWNGYVARFAVEARSPLVVDVTALKAGALPTETNAKKP